MGIGCVLLLWTMFGVVAAIAAACGAFLLATGVRARSTPRVVAGAVLAGFGTIAAVGAILFVVSWLTVGSRPHDSNDPAEFRAEFGFAPGPDVQSIRTQSSGSTDSSVRFLRFRASPETITAIASRRFKSVPFDRCEQEFWLQEKPAWWQPRRSPSATCYVAQPYDTAFATNEAWLAYDAASGEAHYYYAGID